MGLAFVPLYIKYIGIESYGLIGIFAIVQAWLTLLDMGLVPALSREMSRFTGGVHSAESIWTLLRSVEVLLLLVAVIFAICAHGASGWLSVNWINTEKIPASIVQQAVVAMGFVAALRLLENVYKSCLVGLQLQLSYNVINSFFATLRGVGAVAVLAWYSPTVLAFFAWQAIVSICSVVAMFCFVYKAMPARQQTVRFSFSALREIGGFAGGVVSITFLALLLTQVDKILLSKFLSLSEFGYYSLAALLANGLYMIVGPINQAFFPRFSELFSRKSEGELVESFHLGAQLVSVFLGVGGVVLIFFSEFILRIWTGDLALSIATAPLLSILSLGCLLNGLLWIPYQMQLAHAWTSLGVKMNIVAIIFIVPAIVWIAPRYGALGVAWVWVVLNCAYLFLGMHFMFRKIMRGEKWTWYFNDVAIPLFCGVAVAGVFRLLFNDVNLLVFSVAVISIFFAFFLAAGRVRNLFIKRFAFF